MLIHSIFGIPNYQIIVGFKTPISPDRTNGYLVSNTSSAGKNPGLFLGGGGGGTPLRNEVTDG